MKRPVCVLLMFVCVALCLESGVAQTTTTTTDVDVTYQINVQHTGNTTTTNMTLPLRVKWSVDLGATVGYPLIAAGKVFVIAGPDSSGNVNLYALSALNGATVWGPVLIPQGYYWWAAAAYENGKIFVVPNTVSGLGSGAMYAFDANTGAALWSTILPGQYFFTAPPTAKGGIVYTSGAGGGGTVYAVRESDGAVLWTASVMNGDDSSPVVASGSVYVSYVCPQTYKFSASTGALIWHYSGPCEGGGGATPVLYEGLLYVRDWSMSSGHNGDILNATSGQLVGFFDSNFAPAFRNGTGFYVQSSNLKALSVTSGVTIWTATPTVGDTYSTPPIIVNGIVYVGTTSGMLLGYRAGTGVKAVSMNLGYPISAPEGGSVGSPESGLGGGQGDIVVPASTHLFALSH